MTEQRTNGQSAPTTHRECDQRWGQLHEWIRSIDHRLWGILVGTVVLLIGIMADIFFTLRASGAQP